MKKTHTEQKTITAYIDIESDNDFDVLSPIGTFHAYGPELKHTIIANSEEELRREIVWFLAQLKIQSPYCENGKSVHVDSFRVTIYEAMNQIASGGNLIFSASGNRELHITV